MKEGGKRDRREERKRMEGGQKEGMEERRNSQYRWGQFYPGRQYEGYVLHLSTSLRYLLYLSISIFCYLILLFTT